MKKRLVSLGTIVVTIAVALSIFSFSALHNTKAATDASVNVYTDQVLEPNYMGLGFQWEPYYSAQQNVVNQRIAYMKPGTIRTMISADYYVTGIDGNGNPTYDWNSGSMQGLYTLLDFTKQNNIDVMIGEWNEPGFGVGPTDPKWARMIADYLYQLHYVKGYTNVKYYNMLNEPNGLGSWTTCCTKADWETAIGNLYSELSNRGYTSWMKIVGPDDSGSYDWVNTAVDQIPNKLGEYEVHDYATLSDISNGNLESTMSTLKQYIVQHDPQGAAKRFYISESGMVEGKIEAADTQPNRQNFNYGVWMSDFVIQSIRAGQAGDIAWDLDDAMHTHSPSGYGSLNLKGWGFWNSYGGTNGYPTSDLSPYPWFYPWATLSRNFPRGSQTLIADATNVYGLRMTAAKIPAGNGKYNLSFAIVNDSTTPRSLNFSVPGAGGPVTLSQYNYFDGDRPTDGNGFPVAKLTMNGVNLQNGVQVNLPSQGVVILTTLDAGTAITLNGGGTPPTATPAPSLVGQIISLNAAANGSYVSANIGVAGNPLQSTAATAQAWEQYLVVDAGGGNVALKSIANNNFVSANLSATNVPLQATAATAQAWEFFQPVFLGGRTIAFKSIANGLYVSAWVGDPNTPLEARAANISTWETFSYNIVGGTPPTATPVPPTATKPAATNTPRPKPTNTVKPGSTSTPKPLPTNTVKPAATNTPKPLPTATPGSSILGRTISLKAAANGLYASTNIGSANNPVETTATRASTWEQFVVVDMGGGNIALRALANNNYVTANLNGTNTPLQATAATAQAWEIYQLINLGNGNIAFKSQANGLYVSAWVGDPNTPLEARGAAVSTWETFQYTVY